jgi:putative hydrolase of the HAD superfamily
VTIDAVIFDWGGTLTPWHTIDHVALWQAACAPHFPADYQDRASAILAAELQAWDLVRTEQLSTTLAGVFARAAVSPTAELLASYRREFEPHTFTDPVAAATLIRLRSGGIKIGLLSNTLWPRDWHDEILRRDGVLELFDGTVYSSEIPWAKPHREAFLAAMTAAGATDPARCAFVGDRPWDDIHGAKQVGMRTIFIPHSQVPGFGDVTPDAVISDLSEIPATIESW